MNVNDILDKNTICTNLNLKTKDEAIEYLVDVLFEQKYISNKDMFKTDIYKREEVGQTGIGNYIAIPHGLSQAVDKVGVAIGILKDEINWETLDDNGVKIIILFSVGIREDGTNDHLKLLSTFARKLGNDEVVEKLKEAQTPSQVIEAFN